MGIYHVIFHWPVEPTRMLSIGANLEPVITPTLDFYCIKRYLQYDVCWRTVRCGVETYRRFRKMTNSDVRGKSRDITVVRLHSTGKY
jgi:hypothetical protein